MTFAVRIKDNNTHGTPWLFEQTFNTPEEFSITRTWNSKRSIGFLEALVIPVRTDNFQNFCKDFFLPSFFNGVFRINGIVGFIFQTLAALVFDLVTLPIRCVTVIPRYYVNTMQPRNFHPLHQYLSSRQADNRLLNRDAVFLKLEWMEVDMTTGVPTQKRMEKWGPFNFIDLPESAARFDKGVCSRRAEMGQGHLVH